MPWPVSIQNTEHYVWGSGCDGWHLVRTGALSVIQERMPPDTADFLVISQPPSHGDRELV